MRKRQREKTRKESREEIVSERRGVPQNISEEENAEEREDFHGEKNQPSVSGLNVESSKSLPKKRRKKQSGKRSKKRRHGRSDSSDEGMEKRQRAASKRPNEEKGSGANKRKKDEEPENSSNSETFYSAKEHLNLPFKTAKEHLTPRPKELSDRRGTKRPRDDIPESSQKRASCTPSASLTLESLTFHKMLGEGSFGKVMLASHPATKQQLAVKMVKKSTLIQESIDIAHTERRVLEITGQSSFFTHGYAAFQTAEYVFFVMEYLNGGELLKLINSSAPLDIPTIRFLAAEMVCGLQFLHTRGIIHRDIKPENVLLDDAGHVKIADFGLSATNVFGEQKISESAGTPGYMAPEMILGMPYNATVDWFAIGIILYQMATGTCPFDDGPEDFMIQLSVLGVNPIYPEDLNPQLQDLIERLLCKSATEREEFCSRIREHPFFCGINWAELEAGRTQPPFVIEPDPVMGLHETIAVSEVLSSSEAQETPISPEDQRQFCGFSFVSDRWRNMEKTKPEQSLTPALLMSVLVCAWSELSGLTWTSQDVLYDVTGEERVLCMEILSPLKTLQTVSGRQQLVDVVSQQSAIHQTLNPADPDCAPPAPVYAPASAPLFKLRVPWRQGKSSGRT